MKHLILALNLILCLLIASNCWAAGCDSSATYLNHFNCTDGNSDAVEEDCPGDGTITTTWVATAQCDSGITKFDNTLLLDGNSDYVHFPSTDVHFGGGNYTIDGWMYFNVGAGAAEIPVGIHDTTAGGREWQIVIEPGTPSIQWVISEDGSATDIPVNAAIPDFSTETWFHFAVVRQSSTDSRVFIDGTQVGSTYATDYTLHTSSTVVSVGCDFGTGTARQFIDGNLEEIRLSKGLARWTGNFTPPTSEYTIPGKRIIITKRGNKSYKDSYRYSYFQKRKIGGGYDRVIKNFCGRTTYDSVNKKKG